MKFVLLVAISFSLATASFAQTQKINSLKTLVYRASDANLQLDALLNLCSEYNSMNIDTLKRYAFWAQQAARQSGDRSKMMMADMDVEAWLEKRNLLDTSLSICNSNLSKLTYTGNWDIYAQTITKKGVLLIKLNQRKEAMALAFAFLAQAESKEDTISQIFCKYIISNVYRYMEQTQTALDWALKAEHTGIDTAYIETKNNIGVYFLTGMMYNWRYNDGTVLPQQAQDSVLAVQYLNKSIVLSRRYQSLSTLARSLCVMADQTEGPGNMEFAGNCLRQASQIYNDLGDTVSLINSITAMSNYYVSLNEPEKGVQACLHAIDMIKRGTSFPLPDIYWTLGECYEAAGDYKNFSEVLKRIITLKDSVYRKNTENDLAALNAKYEDVKKENTIIQQQYALTKKNYLIYGSLVLLVLAGLVFYLLLKDYRRKQKIKIEQLQAEEKQLSLKAITEAEENQRKRIAADLHDNLGGQANAILYGTEQLMQAEGSDTLVNDLHDTAKDMLLSLRETLWAMKTTDVTTIDVWLRIINFSMQMKKYYRSINITTTGTPPEGFELSAAKALHAILIIQEAVNNAVRHSGAEKINIHSEFETGDWRIKVADNGKGFNLKAMQNIDGHYGLGNMQERAKAAGLAIYIESAPQKGTDIWVSIPIIRGSHTDAPKGVLQTALA